MKVTITLSDYNSHGRSYVVPVEFVSKNVYLKQRKQRYEYLNNLCSKYSARDFCKIPIDTRRFDGLQPSCLQWVKQNHTKLSNKIFVIECLSTTPGCNDSYILSKQIHKLKSIQDFAIFLLAIEFHAYSTHITGIIGKLYQTLYDRMYIAMKAVESVDALTSVEFEMYRLYLGYTMLKFTEYIRRYNKLHNPQWSNKTRNRVQISHDGYENMNRSLSQLMEYRRDSNVINVKPDDAPIFLMFAAFCTCTENYLESQKFSVIAICIADSLYLRLKAIIGLMGVCVKQKQYIMESKLCKCGSELVNGHFVNCNKFFQKHMENTIKVKSQICCYNCGIHCKLKACVGCMIAVYCSRKCQKIHWNIEHRNQCNKSWSSDYKELRRVINV
eukprot:508095_1